MFSYKIYEIFKNAFFYRTPLLWWLLLAVNSVNQWRHTESLCSWEKKWYTWTVLLKLVFLDNEYSSEVFQTLYSILVTLHEKAKSSRPGLSCKKGVFENFANQKRFSVNFAKFSRTHFSWNTSGGCFWKAKSRSSLPEVFCKKGAFENFAKQEVFSCEFFKIFKNTFFHWTSPVAA